MNITMLTSTPPTKGISKYSASLVDALSSIEDVEVLSFKSMYPNFLYPGGADDLSLRPIEESKSISIRRFLTWYNPVGWVYAGLTVRGDILHVQWWTYVLAPVYATIMFIAKIRGKKIVVTMHNVKPHEGGVLKELANKSIVSLGSHYIVHTEEGKKDFVELYKKSEDSVDVVPHGILMPDAPMRNLTKSEARSLLKIPKDKKVLLFFGIIREYKGLDVLMDAFAKVVEEVPEALLVIAGKPWQDWMYYQNFIDSHNLADFIKTDLAFIPEDDIEKYYQTADIVVLPYRHFDAQSGAGMLALPFGRAMVVTDTGGLSGLVRDSRAIVKPGDADEMSKILVTILKDESLQKKMERDSLLIASGFAWGSIAKKTVKLYKSL